MNLGFRVFLWKRGMKGEATYKLLNIPGAGVRYLDSDWDSDFTLLSLSYLISRMEIITVPTS